MLCKFVVEYSNKSVNQNQSSENGSEDGNESIIMNLDDHDRGMDVVTTYDDLIQKYVSINQAIENDEIDKRYAEYIKSVFINKQSAQVLSEDLEKDIQDLVKTLNDEYAIVQSTAKELNEYLGANYLNMLNSVLTSQKVNIKLYIALAVVFFLSFGCAGAVVVGRLKDFIEYILYTDKITKLPNRQMCDIYINALSEKQLEEQFTCMIITLDNLMKVNDTLGRKTGDMLLGDFGEMIKSLTRNYGFAGYNKAGWFFGFYEDCSTSKAQLFSEMLEKSVEDYNQKHVEIQIEYTVAFSNSTDEKVYEIRRLIHCTTDKMK